MPKYEITLTALVGKTVTIDASSEADARELVGDETFNFETDYVSDSFEVVEITEKGE